MKKTTWRKGATLIGATGLLAAVACPQADFAPMGFFQGGDASYGLGISRDGRTVVGAATTMINGFMRPRAIQWTLDGGLVDLGALPGTLNQSVANAITNDQNYASGSSAGSFQFAVRFGQRFITSIKPSFGVQSFEGLDLSGDGRTVVGYQGISNSSWVGFRWTSTEGTISLDPISNNPLDVAYHVSADGLVTVGHSRLVTTNATVQVAVWWDINGHVQQIGPLPGSKNNSYAFDCDKNGRFVYCWGYDESGTSSSVYVFDRLLQTKTVLDVPTGWEYVQVRGCSQDGLFCVGEYWNGVKWRPYIYGPGRGMEDLGTVMVGLGESTCADWKFDRVFDVAQDTGMLRIVGYGASPDNRKQGYLASIPMSRYIRAAR